MAAIVGIRSLQDLQLRAGTMVRFRIRLLQWCWTIARFLRPAKRIR